jgi:UTP-glucose-1-phosphate uridylyltransferase
LNLKEGKFIQYSVLKSRGKKIFIFGTRESESEIIKMVERILEEEKSTDIIPGRFMLSSKFFLNLAQENYRRIFLKNFLKNLRFCNFYTSKEVFLNFN